MSEKTIETKDRHSLIDRRSFMKLPLEERRRILAEQAEKMASFYESDKEWRKLEGGDLIEE